MIMKKFSILYSLLLVSILAGAQTPDRTTPPALAKAKKFTAATHPALYIVQRTTCCADGETLCAFSSGKLVGSDGII